MSDKLFVKLLSENAKAPKKGTNQSAGYDLYSSADAVFTAPNTIVEVPTDVAFTVPEGTYGRIAPRSGLAKKYGINVGAGVIDRDYVDGVVVILYAISLPDGKPFTLPAGTRVAQLILEKICHAEVQVVEQLPTHDEAHAGFGSTGF